MSATVSTKRNRVYPHKFDWDRARELRADGWTLDRIAGELGVSIGAVRRVVDPKVFADLRDYCAAYQASGECVRCGAQCSRSTAVNPKGICRSCRADDETTSVLPGVLRCFRCNHWLPDTAYTPSNLPRYQRRRWRRHHCRLCENAMRRDRRARNGSA